MSIEEDPDFVYFISNNMRSPSISYDNGSQVENDDNNLQNSDTSNVHCNLEASKNIIGNIDQHEMITTSHITSNKKNKEELKEQINHNSNSNQKDNQEKKITGRKIKRSTTVDDTLSPQVKKEDQKDINIKSIRQEIFKNEKTTDETDDKTPKKIKKENNPTIRVDNLRREAFFAPMNILKQYFKYRFKMDFNNFDCAKLLGISLIYMKFPLGLFLYQLLSFYDEYKINILNQIQPQIEEKEKIIFIYFMTRTYEEIYDIYINGNIHTIIYQGKLQEVIKLDTLDNVLKRKRIEKSKRLCESVLDKTILKFEELSRNMIEDINNDELKRKNEQEIKNPFVPIEIDELNTMRNYFN